MYSEKPDCVVVFTILDMTKGAPFYSNFFNEELRKNPALIQKRVAARELIIHSVVGKFAGYTAVANPDCSDLNKMLESFRDEFERVYHEGLDSVKKNVGHMFIIDGMIKRFIIDKEGI
ncbi:MAG: hypothetical protein KAQ65_11710 [Candidatus Thorarchaeota archaeon]|nr:hypothetical protein [Candidatus Thorarchaeota archaeon]